MEARPLPQAGHRAGTWTHVALFMARLWRDVGKGLLGRGNSKARGPEDVPVCRPDKRSGDGQSSFMFLPYGSYQLLKDPFQAVLPASCAHHTNLTLQGNSL